MSDYQNNPRGENSETLPTRRYRTVPVQSKWQVFTEARGCLQMERHIMFLDGEI